MSNECFPRVTRWNKAVYQISGHNAVSFPLEYVTSLAKNNDYILQLKLVWVVHISYT